MPSYANYQNKLSLFHKQKQATRIFQNLLKSKPSPVQYVVSNLNDLAHSWQNTLPTILTSPVNNCISAKSLVSEDSCVDFFHDGGRGRSKTSILIWYNFAFGWISRWNYVLGTSIGLVGRLEADRLETYT